jgi:cytochrome P450
MEMLNGLPYLDAVARETLRLYSPVSSTIRVATKDDVIPTEHEWVDKHGVRRNGIPYASVLFVGFCQADAAVWHCRVAKGDSIFIPILAINRSEDIWGEDARVFKCVPTCFSGPSLDLIFSVT